MNDRKPESYRFLAGDCTVLNDPFITGLNNHDLVVGSSSAGKTECYVIPNLLLADHSMVVVDTKGLLYRRYRNYLKKRGMNVMKIDFVNPDKSCTYNMLDYVRKDRSGKGYRQKDLKSIAAMMLPDNFDKEKIWVDSSRLMLISLMAYVMEQVVDSERNMKTVARIYQKIAPDLMDDKTDGIRLFEELRLENPDSFAVSMYDMFRSNAAADKMMASISMFVGAALEPFVYDDMNDLLAGSNPIKFRDIGRKKTVLFVNISDTDRSMDGVIGVFYQQMFQNLVDEADTHDDGRLDIPVRIILDDFASNFVIPDFDKLLTTIRSRRIYASVVIQSVSQLETMYEKPRAKTIFNNCDCKIFIGSQDRDTADFIADMAGCLPETVMTLKSDQEYVVIRGEKPKIASRIKPRSMDVQFGV